VLVRISIDVLYRPTGMWTRVRRSIGKKLLLAVGVPSLVLALGGVLWLRHEARVLSPHLAPGSLDPAFDVAIGAVLLLAGAMALTHLLVVHVLLDRPLQQLAHGIERARGGDFLQRVPVDRDDELGDLAASFNATLAAVTDLHARRIEDAASMDVMRRELALKAELERRLRELALLAGLGRTLAATLDEEELLPALAARVAAGLGLAEVQVLRRDEGEVGEALTVRATSGDPAALGTRVVPGAAPPGLALVPMVHRDGCSGALAVRRADGAPPSPDEARLLDAVARQTALALANAALHRSVVRLSQTDPLTGAANRRSLFARLEAELERSERFDHATGVAFVDVDHFKRFNDALGHPAGDEVLRRVVAILGSAVRKVDLVGRYGGEEFGVVLARADRAAALAAAEKLRAAVAAAAIGHPAPDVGRVTISIGVAVYPDDGRDVASLVDAADAALYAAKRAGRNTAVAYAPGMREEPSRRRDVSVTADADAGVS
jgi:diguanylate cyclase (GGDEF)-like protein